MEIFLLWPYESHQRGWRDQAHWTQIVVGCPIVVGAVTTSTLDHSFNALRCQRGNRSITRATQKPLGLIHLFHRPVVRFGNKGCLM